MTASRRIGLDWVTLLRAPAIRTLVQSGTQTGDGRMYRHAAINCPSGKVTAVL
jgi:hypothetical protein